MVGEFVVTDDVGQRGDVDGEMAGPTATHVVGSRWGDSPLPVGRGYDGFW